MRDLVQRLISLFREAGGRVVEYYRNLSLSVKIFLWIPFQGILFWVQPWIADTIVWIWNSSAVAASGLSSLDFRTLLLSVLVAFLILQTTLLFLKLNRIEALLSHMAADQGRIPAPDGGSPLDPPSEGEDDEEDTSGAGALGGAIAGGAIGSSFGPAGTIGGAVLGMILGDEMEKNSQEKESSR